MAENDPLISDATNALSEAVNGIVKSSDQQSGRNGVDRPSSYGTRNRESATPIHESHSAVSPTSSNMMPKLAVEARGVHVVYGSGKKKLSALQGVDLSLPEGAIYGLLGPSGCGKTSLLRCVVGRITPNEGKILVFGYSPNSSCCNVPGPGVGYMPQDIALYQEFTIADTLTYFGRLYMMDMKLIRERIAFLLQFLALPEETRMIQNLSGGQSRRVSLAAALIHNPPLLILDEPTVGVDPLLRESIWDHLVTLTTKEGMTVIITTHYIEEARKAHMVGLMRNGRILAESSPERLIKAYGLNSLEEVFLKLCRADNDDIGFHSNYKEEPSINGSINNKDAVIQREDERASDDEACTEVATSDKEILYQGADDCAVAYRNMNREKWYKAGYAKTKAMFLKNFIRLFRNLPDPFDLMVGVYNAEPSSSLGFGNKFLDTIKSGDVIIQEKFNSKAAAIDSVYKGDTWAAISIPTNFSANLVKRFEQGMSADNATVRGSTIEVYPDMTNEQIGYVLKKVLLTGYEDFVTDLLKEVGLNPQVAQPIVETEKPIYGDENPSYTEFMAPGIILSITYQMALGLTALSFVLERKEGLLDRSWVAGVTATEVLLSHFLTQLIVIIVQVALLLVFTFWVFQIPSHGPMFWAIVLILLQGMCGMAYGLLISSFCQEERTAIMTALGTFYPNLILSGIFWPVEAMPMAFRYISACLPQTLACKSLRCILSRGWGITHTQVWQAYLITIGWLLVFIIIAGILFRAKK